MFEAGKTMLWGSWLVYAQHQHLQMVGPAKRPLSPLFVPWFVKLKADEPVAVKKRGATWLVQRDLTSPRMRWVATPAVTAR